MSAPPTKRRRPHALDPDDARLSAHVRLVAKHYDAFCARAGAQRETLPEMIRRAVIAANLVAKNRQGG